MNTKWTKAPWLIQDHEFDPCEIYTDSYGNIAHVFATDFEEGKANSLLIAAAPSIAESLGDAVIKLRDMAAVLEVWANESRLGGWSTHQVDANRAEADRLRGLAATYEAALKKAGAL